MSAVVEPLLRFPVQSAVPFVGPLLPELYKPILISSLALALPLKSVVVSVKT